MPVYSGDIISEKRLKFFMQNMRASRPMWNFAKYAAHICDMLYMWHICGIFRRRPIYFVVFCFVLPKGIED